MSDEYVLFGGELSLFTRKLEAALKFYGAPFDFQPKRAHNAAELEHRSGTHQVPVLQTPENWMIGDTTPIIDLLDGRFPARRMVPDGPLGVLVHIVEEYLDEWVARTMVHYRWHYPESAKFASLKMSGGDEAAAARVLNWGPRACRATGTESVVQQRAAEDEYVRLLTAAEAQLGETAFLMGDRPTSVDCIVLGGLRAHTNMDPDPKKVTAGFARVVQWSEQLADAWDGAGELAPFTEPTQFSSHIIAEMVSTYKPYVLANARAHAAGAKACHAHVYGEDVSYLTRPYPERSRAMVSARIARLSATDQAIVRGWLQAVLLDDVF